MLSLPLFISKIYFDKSADSLMGVSLYVISLLSCCFDCFLYLSICQFSYNVCWYRSSEVQSIWDPLRWIDLDTHFSPQVHNVFGYYCFKYTFYSFLLLFSWDSYKYHFFLLCLISLVGFLYFIVFFSLYFSYGRFPISVLHIADFFLLHSHLPWNSLFNFSAQLHFFHCRISIL